VHGPYRTHSPVPFSKQTNPKSPLTPHPTPDNPTHQTSQHHQHTPQPKMPYYGLSGFYDVSPPRSPAEQPRNGYFPDDYRSVSPLGFGGGGRRMSRQMDQPRPYSYPAGPGGRYRGGPPVSRYLRPGGGRPPPPRQAMTFGSFAGNRDRIGSWEYF
jgi:hypothetical protein